MKILVLTKTKYQFLKKGIKNANEYIQSDSFFSGWISAFQKSGHDIISDSRSFYFLPLKLAFKFPNIYIFLAKVTKKLRLHLIDRFFLSQSIKKLAKKQGVNLIFTELNDFLTIKAIEELKSEGIIVAQWVGIYPEMLSNDLLCSLDYYNHILTPGDIQEEFRKAGIKNAKFHYIGCSYNEKLLYNDYDPIYAYDIVFVGGITEKHLNRIAILEKIADNFDNFAFYGYGIDYFPANSKVRKHYKGWAEIKTIRKLFSSSKIALNLTLDNYDRYKHGINARAFEIPACKGAVQLALYHKNFDDFFNENEIVFFHNIQDIVIQIKSLLKRNDLNDIVARSYLKNKINQYINKIKLLSKGLLK